MKTVTITDKSTETSRVICRRDVLAKALPEVLKGYRKVFVFSDHTVWGLYGKRVVRALGNVEAHTMTAGEAYKTPETLMSLLAAMAKAGLHRNDCLVCLGGGVPGDVGGLAAALYMRGIDCIQVPTTLLAQVDSSVGGKTAIDFCGVKNLVGAFRQPKYVFADPAFFKTLPLREVRCGLGEIVKHGALDAELFDLLECNREKLFDLEFLAGLVPLNIAFKANVVRQDAKEAGLRKCLNLGHTTAHAYELLDGKLSHGEYVLIGTFIEAEISKARGGDAAYLTRLEELCLAALGEMPALPDAAEAARFACLDKKNTGAGKIVLTVPASKGEYRLLELDGSEYERELIRIGRTLC